VSSSFSVPVPKPSWQLKYRGIAITGRIEKMVVSIEYTSFEGGASPDLEITLEDRDRRWQNPWFPQRGDELDLSIGYFNQLTSCGTFQIDEVELDSPPDQVKMKCLAAIITPDARTPISQQYESVDLGAIANIIATRHGWTLVHAPEAINIQFERVTQNQETDLEFLHRLSRENNYDFTVKGGQLIFYSRTQLESVAAIATFRRGDGNVISVNFKAKTQGTYKAATVSYQNPDTKALITGTAEADPPVAVGDTLTLQMQVENAQDATQKARAALHDYNMLIVTGTLNIRGNATIPTGKPIAIQGFGKFDGKYVIAKAIHRLSRSDGYKTQLELRSVNAPADASGPDAGSEAAAT
jgi:phage protein D